MTAPFFARNLSGLPPADGLARLEVLAPDGSLAAAMDNRPGSRGSIRIYSHLADKWGAIDSKAATEGLDLYAEHVDEAKRHPGTHPHIDLLLEIAVGGASHTVRRVPARPR